MHTVTITFANGSTDQTQFDDMPRAYHYCNNHICYTTTVVRVTIDDRAVWDTTWNDVSKYQGLIMPL